jgi:hypothetical protein
MPPTIGGPVAAALASAHANNQTTRRSVRSSAAM